jgi:hypothetical protein
MADTLNQIKPNLAVMVLGWVPFKIVSDSPAFHSRWLLLLKIEISLIRFTGFRGEDLNVKVYDVRRTPSDGKSSHGL